MIDLTGPENFLLPRPYLTWFLAGVGPKVVRDISLGLTEDKDGDRFNLPPSSFAGVGPKTDEESSLGFGLTEVGESEETTSSSTTSGNLIIDPTTMKNLIGKLSNKEI